MIRLMLWLGFAVLLAGCATPPPTPPTSGHIPAGGDCDISQPAFSVKQNYNKSATLHIVAKLEAAAKKDLERLKAGADGALGKEYQETVSDTLQREFVISPAVQEIAYEMWLVECAIKRGSLSRAEGEKGIVALIDRFAAERRNPVAQTKP